MTYKWTLDYIDERLTWPTIKDLLAAIREYPPADLVVPAMLKGQAAGNTSESIPSHMARKKGKVGKVVMK